MTATAEEQASPTAREVDTLEGDVHVVVLHHGLWGNPDHLGHVQRSLERQLSVTATGRHLILNIGVNREMASLDGIDTCGERAYDAILELIELVNNGGTEGGSGGAGFSPERRVAEMSFIGYSLGGLIMRYVIGRLYAAGLFTKGGVAATNFMTIATPHLGALRPPTTVVNRIYNACVVKYASQTGRQLALADDYLEGRPLLYIMCRPELCFMQALQLFRKRVLFANIENDRTVPYCTGAIQGTNPYRSTIPTLRFGRQKYPSLVRPAETAEEIIPPREYGKARRRAFLGALLLLFPVLFPLWYAFVFRLCYKSVQRDKTISKRVRGNQWLKASVEAAGTSLAATQHPPGFFDLNSRALRLWMVAQLNGSPSPSLDSSDPKPDSKTVTAFTGIVRDPAPPAKGDAAPQPQEQQQQLFWEKFDVKTYWPHSHAAIVARTKRSPGSEDVAQFLVDTYFAPPGTITLGAPEVGIPVYTPPDIVSPAEAASPQV